MTPGERRRGLSVAIVALTAACGAQPTAPSTVARPATLEAPLASSRPTPPQPNPTCAPLGARAISADGALMAVVDGPDLVVWETASWRARLRIPLRGMKAETLRFDPKSRYIAVAADERDPRAQSTLIRLSDGNIVANWRPKPTPKPARSP